MVGTEGLEPSTDSRGISSALSPTELCPQIKNGTGERTRTSRTMGLNHVPMPIRLHPQVVKTLSSFDGFEPSKILLQKNLFTQIILLFISVLVLNIQR